MSTELKKIISELDTARISDKKPIVNPKTEQWIILDFINNEMSPAALFGARTPRQAAKRKAELEAAKQQLLATV